MSHEGITEIVVERGASQEILIWAHAYERPGMEASGLPTCDWEVRIESSGQAGGVGGCSRSL